MAGQDEVLIKVAADIAQAVSSLTELAGSLGEIADKMKGVGDEAESSGPAAVAWGMELSKAFDAVKKTATDAVKAFPAMITGAAHAGDELYTMSKRLNMSADAIGELQYVAEQSGTSMQGLARTIQNFGAGLQDSSSKASQAVKGLGLNVEELKKMKPEDAFYATIKAIQALPESANKSAVAMEAFGGRFRMSTQLLSENTDQLRESFKKLTAGDDLEKLAKEGDRYSDALNNIHVSQEAFKNQIAEAVLPVVNDLLEAMPGLGGAALTVGGGFLDMAKNMAPVLQSIALFQSTNLLGTLSGLALKLPGVTALMTALGVSTKGTAVSAAAVGPAMEAGAVGTTAMSRAAVLLQASLGPIAIALAAIAAGVYAWKKSSEETGFFRTAADELKVLKLRLDNYDEAVARRIVADEHAAQRAKEAAEARAAADKAAGKGPDPDQKIQSATAALAALTKQEKEYAAQLAYLAPAERAALKTLLEKSSAEQVYKDTGVGSVEMLKFYQTQLKATTKAEEDHKKELEKKAAAFAKLPLQKFITDTKELADKIDLARAAGLSETEVLKRFGDSAADAADKAREIPGALATIPPSVKAVGTAFTAEDLAKKVRELDAEIMRVPNTLAAIPSAAVDALNAMEKEFGDSFEHIAAMNRELSDVGLSAHEKKMKSLDDEMKKEIERVNKSKIAGTQIAKDEIATIEKVYAARRKAEDDAEKRRILGNTKTKEDLEAGVLAEVNKLTLLRIQGASDAQIKAQERALKAAQDAAIGTENAWGATLDSLTGAFEQMANIAGGSFGGIMKGVGGVFSQMKTAGVGMNALLGGDPNAKPGDPGFKGLPGMNFGLSKESMGKLGGGMAIGAQVAGGIQSFMSGTDKRSGGQRALGGAMAGAQMGSAFGPWGTAIGAGVGAIVGALRKPGWVKAAKDVGRDYGFEISDELAKAIEKSAKDKFGGNRQAGALFNLDAIIGEAGGLKSGNIDKFTSKLRDVFSMVETGKFSAEQGRETLEKNFGAFADYVVKSNKVASKGFQELLTLNANSAAKSEEVVAFVGGQNQRLASGLTGLFAPLSKQIADMVDARQKLADAAKSGNEIDADSRAVYQKLAGDIKGAGDEMGRFERLTLAGFNAAVAAGVPYLEALDQMGPALDQLSDANKKLGREGGAAINELLGIRELAKTYPELVASASSLNEVTLAMSNIGALNVDTMADLQSQGAETFHKLMEAGFSENQALQQMKGYLESVRQAHKDLNLPIDENTAALIEQAEEQGVLKKETMSTNDIMMEGFSAIITALKGDIPEAFKKMKEAALENSKAAAAAVGHVETAVGGIDGALADSEDAFAGWSDEAVAAARDAQAAVDAVSFGSSPGGIKEMPIKLKESIQAFRDWQKVSVGAAGAVRDAIDASAGSVDGIRYAGEMGAASAEDLARAQEDMISLNVAIHTIDTQGMEEAVEKKMLPAITKILRKGGRNLSDIQGVLQ